MSREETARLLAEAIALVPADLRSEISTGDWRLGSMLEALHRARFNLFNDAAPLPLGVRTYMQHAAIHRADEAKLCAALLYSAISSVRLSERKDVPNVVASTIAIQKSVDAFATSDRINIPRVRQMLGQWGADDIELMLLVTYARHLTRDGSHTRYDVPAFVNMAKSFMAWTEWIKTFGRVMSKSRLDRSIAQQKLDELLNSPYAFEHETVSEAATRIAQAAAKK